MNSGDKALDASRINFVAYEIPSSLNPSAMLLRDTGHEVSDEDWLRDCRKYNQWARENGRPEIDESEVSQPAPVDSSFAAWMDAAEASALHKIIIGGRLAPNSSEHQE